ncbi:MAG: hypothetical protein WCF57_20700 [Pyrinomonadaceae bacterium]
MELNFSTKKTTLILVVVVLFLTIASLAGQFSKHVLGHDHLRGLVPLFNVNTEGNLPTWYTSFAILLCAVLLFVIARARKSEGDRYSFHWMLLALIFLYISVDEGAGVHDALDFSLPSIGYLNSAPRYIRMLPVAILLLVFGFIYLKFLFYLPARTRLLFIVAGTLYVGGAFGMGFVMERYATRHGWDNMTLEMLAALEEFMEMIGIVIFIYALMSYMETHLKEMRVRIGDGAEKA